MNRAETGLTPVPTALLSVLLSWRSTQVVDVHALLLSEDGRVRSARDAVFFNAPRHPSQAVTLDQEPPPGTARLSVSLPRTEPEIARILVTGSIEDGDLAHVPGLVLSVEDATGLVARTDVDSAIGPPAPGGAVATSTARGDASVPAPGRAMVFAEFCRRDGRWWFRAAGVVQPGLAELFAERGVPIEGTDRRISLRRSTIDERVGDIRAAPADPGRADWHTDPADPTVLRWWDGGTWTDTTVPVVSPNSRICVRCGRRRGWRVLGAPAPCRACAAEIEQYLTGWRARAWRVLTGDGPHGRAWDELWTALRFRRIDVDTGRAALRAPGLAYLERLAAFADGEIGPGDLDDFEATARALTLTGPLVEDLRRRLQRGRTLSRLRAGDLPTVRTTDLHLDSEERVHMDISATRVRHLARGPKATAGRLICSNKKLRFVGPGAGIELPWSRIVSVTAADGMVVLAATSARGGAEFEVTDPDFVAAALEGALRVAKRLALAPGRRDRRSIPPEIKAEVWQRDGGTCADCGATHSLEFDHIIPLSRGGATSPANLQILCRACNRGKGARI
ncbi:TerD family protein [Nocardia thraciensis]